MSAFLALVLPTDFRYAGQQIYTQFNLQLSNRQILDAILLWHL